MNAPLPIVISRRAGTGAYLLAWERLPSGEWGAHIAWIIRDGHTGKLNMTTEHVLRDDVQPVEGQVYSSVARHVIGGD